MTALTIEPLHPDFGARITDLDVSAPLSEETVEAVRVAVDEHAFVLFPGQKMDDDAHLTFTRYLGEPEPNHVKLGQEGIIEYFGTIGNVQPDGSAIGNDHKRTIFQTGNNMWHSDSSFREVPSFVSIMCAYEVPEEGGQTEFVSERAAYGRLSNDEQAKIDPLNAIHDYVFSRSKVSPDAVTPSHAKSLPPVEQKLVRTNPRTGAKNYYVGSHAKQIAGWSLEDSRPLLDDLLEQATKPEHVYAHAWQPGDVVIWDNRCLLHRGSGYDADKYRRRMRQTRVQGAGPTLSE
ncbi:MAG: TauD/TfdA family dioxygenase [Rhodospirillaceae bacterium]|nr:TauD/TfdA family dioxygenase [Rhodospirillaceae bacterium]MDD9913433.1 TauD/TfdA family dioxygenase [Rhodospirillaceae bacterium]MDD9928148.1 TauD/TfdA family dioxygenase [Rhodospirillaceae bacterium]